MPEYAPKQGYYSSRTQKIANELPSDNEIRALRTSVGQSLINAAAGRHQGDIYDLAAAELRNKFPTVMDLNQPDLVTKVDLPEEVSLEPPTKVFNYLFNSSFEIWPNQSTLPQMWRWNGVGTVSVVNTGFVGNRALSIQCAVGQTAIVYQDLERDVPAGQEWSFSAWYKITDVPTVTLPSAGFGIEAVGYCVDNTTETMRTSFASTTNGYPRKVAVSGSFTKNVYKIRVQVVVSAALSFQFTYPVVVDLFMAEPGGAATSWRPNPFDMWPHITLLQNAPSLWLESGDRAQYVDNIDDFWLRSTPTRAAYRTQIIESSVADPTPSAVDGVISYGTSGRFVETDVFKEDWPYRVEAYSIAGSHKIRFIGIDVLDIYGTFDLALRNYRDYYEPTTVTLEAITYYSGWLWVLHQNADWNGTVKRYLSVVDVRTPWPRPAYLEAIATLEIPTPSVGTLLTRVEFRFDDQQHIYIGDGHTTYVYSLYYDYFRIEGRSIYLREYPTSVTIMEANPTRHVGTDGKVASEMNRSRRTS